MASEHEGTRMHKAGSRLPHGLGTRPRIANGWFVGSARRRYASTSIGLAPEPSGVSFGATIESVVWRRVSQQGRFLRQLVHVFAKEVLFVAI